MKRFLQKNIHPHTLGWENSGRKNNSVGKLFKSEVSLYAAQVIVMFFHDLHDKSEINISSLKEFLMNLVTFYLKTKINSEVDSIRNDFTCSLEFCNTKLIKQ